MRNTLLALASLFSSSLFAASFLGAPAIHQWQGNGEWKSLCGQTGTYQSTISIQDNELTGQVGVEGQNFTYKVAAVTEKNGVFQVTGGRDQSAVVGNGYCFSNHCHYSAAFNGMQVEESFDLVNGNLVVHGSKSSNAKPAQSDCPSDFSAWSATLKAQR